MRLIPLLHHEPAALLVVQLEFLDRRDLGRPLIRRLDVAEMPGPLSQDRDAPVTQLGSGGLLLRGGMTGILPKLPSDAYPQGPGGASGELGGPFARPASLTSTGRSIVTEDRH